MSDTQLAVEAYRVPPSPSDSGSSARGEPPDDAPLIEMAAPSASLFQVGPGVELSAGRYLNLFLRGHAEIPIGGVWIDEMQSGIAGSLQDFDEPVGAYDAGWTVQAGVQVRIGLLGEPSGRTESVLEDEPDL